MPQFYLNYLRSFSSPSPSFFFRHPHVFLADAKEGCFRFSCYNFTKRGTKWSENRNRCQKIKGDLVAIETEAEWSYIIRYLRHYFLRRTPNEWQIGLRKNRTWTWINGKPLTINKWSENQPGGDGNVTVMYKNFPEGSNNYGLFNDLRADIHKPFICELAQGKKDEDINFCFL